MTTVDNGIIEFTGPYTGTYFILDGDMEFECDICSTEGYELNQSGFAAAFSDNAAEWLRFSLDESMGTFVFTPLARP